MAILMVKSALEDFQKALFTALATITTQTTIKIYDHVPQNQENFPYIVVGNWVESPWGDKVCFGSQINFTINSYFQDKTSLNLKTLNDLIIQALEQGLTIENWNYIYHNISDNMVQEFDKSVFVGSLSFGFYMYEGDNGSD